MIEVIGLDGDDTLWHSESHFAEAHDTFAAVLAPYTARGFDLVARHHETELANLEVFGYGVGSPPPTSPGCSTWARPC